MPPKGRLWILPSSSRRENGRPQCSSSYTAAGALRHMYSIVSWSPSQSAPLTVSYMCQRQSSSPMLPSEAAMPPCAATVCERVGKTLVMQAVLRPASLQPSVARSPAPAAPPTPTSKVWSMKGYGPPFTLGAAIGPPVPFREPPSAIAQCSGGDLQHGDYSGRADRHREESVGDRRQDLHA